MQQLCDLKEPVECQRCFAGLQLAIGILGYVQFIGHKILGILLTPAQAMNVLQYEPGANGDSVHMVHKLDDYV